MSCQQSFPVIAIDMPSSLVKRKQLSPPDTHFNIPEVSGMTPTTFKIISILACFQSCCFPSNNIFLGSRQLLLLLRSSCSLIKWVSWSQPSQCGNETPVEVLLPHTSLGRNAGTGRLVGCALVRLDDQRIRTGALQKAENCCQLLQLQPGGALTPCLLLEAQAGPLH